MKIGRKKKITKNIRNWKQKREIQKQTVNDLWKVKRVGKESKRHLVSKCKAAEANRVACTFDSCDSSKSDLRSAELDQSGHKDDIKQTKNKKEYNKIKG